MNKKRVTDLQRVKYNELLHKSLPEIIASFSGNILDDNYKLSCEMLPINTDQISTFENTDYYPVRVSYLIENNVTGETVNFNIDLLHVPVMYELGFKIRGNYMQMLDTYERTTGWNFTKIEAKKDKPEFIVATALGANGVNLNFMFSSKDTPYVTKKITNKSDLSVGMFLRAITGMSNSELISIFGNKNPLVVQQFSNEYSLSDCIIRAGRVILGQNRVDKLGTLSLIEKELKNRIFNKAYFNLGKSNHVRFAEAISFRRRAVGKILAYPIEVNGTRYEAGMNISMEMAEILDSSEVDEIFVSHNDKVYNLKKFSHFEFRCLNKVLREDVPEVDLKAGTRLTMTDTIALNSTDRKTIKVSDTENGNIVTQTRQTSAEHLNKEAVFDAVSIWLNNANGFELFDSPYALTNRVCKTFDNRIEDFIEKRMQSIQSSLTKLIKQFGTNETILLAISELKLDDRKNTPLKEAQDQFINEIRNTDSKEGQMSDMCNILAYISKSNKLTTDIGANNASDEMRAVQATQEGRLDQFDSPESAKIGLVHHKTLLADTDENGALVTPYLLVRNGKVVSNEPVMLTAQDEAGKNIAMWNETFVNEDGTPKTQINVRCDNNPAIVSIDKVSYKEYSPIQALSVAHAMIPLPNHSNGKRITMACNQGNQAVPTVNNPERPPLGTGCESIVDFGNYTVDSVLEMFCSNLFINNPTMKQYEAELLKSPLRLKSIQKIGDARHLTFEILAMENIQKKVNVKLNTTTTLEIPYNVKNFNDVLFSFRLNHKENKIYNPGDIIAYSNSYSIEKKERVDCVDYGALKVDESVFDRGLALGRPLVVGYKTNGSSTIEDAITISDRLVYDDTLTHIRIVERKAIAVNTKAYSKEFGKCENRYDYFDTTGLPKIGTVLGPGDPYVAIIKQNKTTDRITQDYRYLRSHDGGKVVKAEIITKNNEAQAIVTIAKRNAIELGDKLAGRHGNKGTIARIVPHEDMPYNPKTGQILDIILNPLGVPSRMNVSQLLEVAIQMCRHLDGKLTNISPYHPDEMKFIREQIEQFDIHPVKLIDGRTGLPFRYPINVGVIYMQKLHHVAESKIHAIGMDAPVDPTFLQPKKGSKSEGGQRVGEMENWSLHGVGANNLLQDLFSIQSDDLVARNNLKKKLLGLPYVSSENDAGNNYNDASILAFVRSMGTEIVSNPQDNTYRFELLTDSIIRSFGSHAVDSVDALHSASIFGIGDGGNRKCQVLNKQRWGYIDLGVQIIHPNHINQSVFSQYVAIDIEGTTKSFGTKMINDIIEGNIYVAKSKQPNVWYGYAIDDNSVDDLGTLYGLDDKQIEELQTGMEAVVSIVKSIDGAAALDLLEKRAEKALETNGVDSEKYCLCIEKVAKLKEFLESGSTFSDYIISSFPVMPQSFRVKLESSSFGNGVPDFDHFYKQIILASDKCKADPSVANQRALYYRICEFIGIHTKTENKNKKAKYKNLMKYFAGTEDEKHHGNIREAIQAKRIVCSGRCIITPAREKIKPTELGVPILMLVKMFQVQLSAFFSKKASQVDDILSIRQKSWEKLFTQLANNDADRFKDVYCDVNIGFLEAFGMKSYEAFKKMKEWLKEFFLIGDDNIRPVVFMGRQPTLHKYGIRGFYSVPLWSKAIELNALLCSGFNADFDGDQAWIAAALSPEAADDAITKLSPAVDFINPKNNSIILSHSQDIVLGCYSATMLKDNAIDADLSASNASYYTSVSALESDVLQGLIHLYDLVVLSVPNYDEDEDDYKATYRYYISTAGRILFNNIFSDGFTKEPFTNPLNISGVKNERYCNLKYDGIITSGKSGNDPTPYYSLSDICMERYLTDAGDCIEEFHSIAVFGFLYSDLVGVSISVDDLDIDCGKEAILKEAKEKCDQLDLDFQNGLISAEDKNSVVAQIYNSSDSGATTDIMKNLLANIPRNNNLFIMMDSGARGNKTQLMHMCGSIGILGKTKTTNMADPVTSNYFEGLTNLEVQMTSYSSRVGVASTQMETRQAGEATRHVVYMTDGIAIKEIDCGKSNWWFDIRWDDIIPELSRFTPSEVWVKNNLLKSRIIACDGTSVDGEVITEENAGSYAEFLSDGFNTLTIRDAKNGVGVITADYDLLKESKILPSDEENTKKFSHLVDANGRLDINAILAFDHYKTKHVETDFGTLDCRYHMTDRCKSELLYREARNLEHLATRHDAVNNDKMDYITPETIKWIEQEGLDTIEARVMLDCKCSDGVCAHCYGLRLSTLKIPQVGDLVGTESAQSIGEPSAQLTMDVINKGGVAGASIASGIKAFKKYLGGNVASTKDGSAVIPDESGYIHIDKLDDSATLIIEPIDKKCAKCMACIQKNLEANGFDCPLTGNGAKIDPQCTYGNKIASTMISYRNGEFVESGFPVTEFPPESDSVISVKNSKDPAIVLRRKQEIWIDNYYKVFKDQSISINARHFELLAMVQNNHAMVLESDSSNFRVGETYTTTELMKALDDGVNVKFKMSTTNLHQTICLNSGMLTALTFNKQAGFLANATFRGMSNNVSKISPIGKITVGQDLNKPEVKVLKNTKIKVSDFESRSQRLKEQEEAEKVFEIQEVNDDTGFDLNSDMGDFNLDSFGDLFGDVTPPTADTMSAFGSTAEEQASEQASPSSEQASPAEESEGFGDFGDFDVNSLSSFTSRSDANASSNEVPEEAFDTETESPENTTVHVTIKYYLDGELLEHLTEDIIVQSGEEITPAEHEDLQFCKLVADSREIVEPGEEILEFKYESEDDDFNDDDVNDDEFSDDFSDDFNAEVESFSAFGR